MPFVQTLVDEPGGRAELHWFRDDRIALPETTFCRRSNRRAAPSMGVPVALHDRFDYAVMGLRRAGFIVEVGEFARRDGLIPGPASARQAELMAAFTGPVRAVFPPWGGELAIELVGRTD